MVQAGVFKDQGEKEVKCPNCGKEYHWCFSCGWDAGEFACSYECAVVLYQEGKIDKMIMEQWALEDLFNIRHVLSSSPNSAKQARVAKVVRSKK